MRLLKYIFFIYLVSLLYIACKNKVDTIDWNKLEGEYSINKNINVIHSIDTKINYSLKAPIIKPYDKNANINEFSKGFSLNMYDINGKVKSNIKANYGLFFDSKNILEAKKGVIIKTSKNEIIKTEHITWDQKKDKIYTDAFVTIQTDKRILNGYGLESTNNLQEFRLKKVFGTVYINN